MLGKRRFFDGRGQVALELIMTYGWVILLVLIAVGALFYFGVLDVSSLARESCDFPSLVACSDFEVAQEGIALSLRNLEGEDMLIRQIRFSSGALRGECALSCGPGDARLGSGKEEIFAAVIGSCGFQNTRRGKNAYDVEIDYSWEDTPGLTDTLRGSLFANSPCSSCASVNKTIPRTRGISLAVSPGRVMENDSTRDLTVVATLTGGISRSCSVNSTVTLGHEDGSARAGSDYSFPARLPAITIPAGQIRGEGSFRVRLTDNYVIGGDKTFSITGQASGFDVSKGTVTILDNDVTAKFSVPPSYSLLEGNATSQANITVSLNAPASRPVSVNYTTADGTAKAGTDYAAKSGILRFGVGESSKTIVINVTGDVYVESDETFSIILSSPVNAIITRGTSRVTIINDDMGICGRTQQVRSALLRLQGITDCASAKPGGIIINFDLNGRGIGSLQAGDFDKMNRTTTIRLNRNALTSLPPDIFDDLTDLKELSLNHNSLTSLPPDIFDNLTRLESLFLSNNSLSSLPLGIFDNLARLFRVDLSSNSLSSLPLGIFGDNLGRRTQLFGLWIVNLSSNNLSSLPPNIFDNLTKLHTLDLRGNPNLRLSPGTFAKTTRLQYLYLSSATNRSLPSGIFDNITNRLFTVRVYQDDVGICGRTQQVRNAILGQIAGVSDCADVTDAHLRRITFLNVNSLRISSLQEGDFGGLTGLTSLNLHDNGLSSLPPNVFADLTSLTFLNLGDNEINSLQTGDFGGLVNLETLEMYRNNLSSLPPGIFDNLTRMDRLSLSQNNVSSLPPNVFDDLTSLTTLDIYANSLSSLPPGIFANLTSIKVFQLGQNNLSSLPPNVFANLARITKVDLSVNRRLSSLPPNAFANLTRMSQLWLHGNRLSSLPASAFANLTGMRELGLHGNRLSSLPRGIFDDMTGIKKLYLDTNCNLRLNSGVFAKTTQLNYISISRPTNSSLPSGIFANLTNSSFFLDVSRWC